MERQRIDLRDDATPSPHVANRNRVVSLVFSLTILLGLYAASLFIPVGWFTYILTLPPLAVIIITAGVRASDMSCDMVSPRWSVRRNGYILTGLFAVTQLVAPLKGLVLGSVMDWPTWRVVIGTWGFAMVWITSPGLPPWPRYVWNSLHENPTSRPVP